MLRQFSTRRIISSFLLDWLGTLLALLLAVFSRAGMENFSRGFLGINWFVDSPGGGGVWPTHLLTPQVLILVSLIWPVFFIVFSVYDGRRNENLKAELINVFMATVASTLVLAGVLFLTYRETSRGLFLIFFLLDLTILLGWRIAWYAFRASQNGKRNARLHPVLVVGDGLVGQNVAFELRKFAGRDINLIGFIDDDPDKQGREIAGLPVLGTMDQLLDVIGDYNVSNAVVALPLRAHQQLIEISRTLQEAAVRVHIIPDLFALSFPGATLDGFGGIPLIDLGQPGIHGGQRVVKRVFDVLVVTFILILLSPIFLVISILIKLDSPGPVFYKDERIGENGQPFTMYKFRSMKVNSDASIHREHVTRLIGENISPEQLTDEPEGTLKMEKDPRITKVGHFIRKTSLDELPQLFNVLHGEMSLVGPRPSLPYEVEIFKEWHKRRFESPPGITGLWQVEARNQVSFDEMVRMDLEYIEKYSIWLDIRIVLQTPWELIKGKGAG
ncbi:MAG: sugar transferase [Anaerolineales bacterium]